MSCNCQDTNNSCADNRCSCGVFIDVFEGSNLLHTYFSDYNCDCNGFSFSFNEGSIPNVFHEDDREVIVRYNEQFERWEMVFYDDKLEGYIPFALYYTKDSVCPDGDSGFTIGSCGWDDNRNVTYVKIDSVVVGVAVWNGTRTNGYKVYEYIPSVYPGTYTNPFTISVDIPTLQWRINLNGTDIAFAGAGAIPQTAFPNGSFTNILPFSGTIFLDTYNGLPPTPGNESPSGTLNIVKIRAIDCGCCDESVIIDVVFDESTFNDVQANIVKDEYGNVLAINGKPYYTFELQLTPTPATFYLYYTGTSWIMSDSLDGEGAIYAELTSTNDCPFGSYQLFRTPVSLFSVIGSECFDCCDYYAPRNRNLLKKKKAIFVEEIASIRNKEIFGLKCGPEWSDLFKKHLIFDVLWCLPYGVLCDDEEQCLINNLNENCNC
jgi:hypothetical protein